MIFLSQLLNKKVYYERKLFGEMVDFAVLESTPNPSVSKVVLKKDGTKLTISPTFLSLKRNGAILTDAKAPLLPFDERDFYLNEDLLDKQVIDIDDKRLVRVNDIVLESNGELKVVGIDVGAAGILRRLGLSRLIPLKPKILPWQMIEAFDYQTGNVKISLTQNRLDAMHPSELADILEDLGSRERLGVVESLEARRAAMAIEEVDIHTRDAILEELSSSVLGKVVRRMHVTKIANLFYRLNPLRIREILNLVGEERAQRVERLLDFSEDQAGGVMRTTFVSLDGDTTIKEVFGVLYQAPVKPEGIVVTNGNQKLVGVVYTKDIIDSDSLALLKDLVTERKFVYPDVDFNQVINLFGRYNLRLLPVVDKNKVPIGVISTGIVLAKIEEKTKADEII
ncbi:MAG: CBS domain-containing protein [Candidatus Levyibacteriota bacterium]|jgi:CBS domain-containing protein